MIRSSLSHPASSRPPWPAWAPPTPDLLERRGAEIALAVRSATGDCRALIGLGSTDGRVLHAVSRLLAPDPFVVMTPAMADAPVDHCLVVLSDADWGAVDTPGVVHRLWRVREMLGHDSALLMHHDDAGPLPTPAPVLAAAGFTYHCAWHDPQGRESVVLAWP